MFRRFGRSPDIQTLLRRLGTGDARRFLAGLPLRSLAPIGAAVFSLFSTVGFITDIMAGGTHPASLLIINVVFGGTIGAVYGYTSLRPMAYRIAAVAVHLSYVAIVNAIVAGGPRLPPDAARLRFDGLAIIVCISVSYTFFLRFIGTTGLQYLSARAEIRLAAEIHAVLVPIVNGSDGEFEFYGVSHASGDVGGDLVDIVTRSPGRWIGYVADVSGHGVSSGLLMGMTKSAAHMRLREEASLGELLDALNDVLFTLKRPSMFVTFVGVQRAGGDELEFSVAGHLPLLHLRASGTIDEVTTPQIPIGMFEGRRFATGRVTCRPGEMLALVTDGLTEVFDRADREYGLDRLKGFLQAHAHAPLPALADALLRDVAGHGPQIDDQTLLLIRRRASLPPAVS